MTIEQARKVLGKNGTRLSDKELDEILASLNVLVDVFIQQQMGVENGREKELH